MNTKQLKRIATLAGLMIGSFAFAVMSETYTWTPATTAAPGDNMPAPINVSKNSQSKRGGLQILGESLNNGYALDVNGPGYFTGLTVSGSIVVNSLFVNSTDKDKAGYVLTNDGTGKAEWKAKGSSSITLSEVTPFSVTVLRDKGLQSFTTPTAYQFCALTRIESEMGRVDSGKFSGGYCQVTKNADGKWKISGYLASDPDYKCEMTCFK